MMLLCFTDMVKQNVPCILHSDLDNATVLKTSSESETEVIDDQSLCLCFTEVESIMMLTIERQALCQGFDSKTNVWKSGRLQVAYNAWYYESYTFNLNDVGVHKQSHKKLIRRWDSDRELSLRRHCTRSKNTLDSCINSARDRFLQHRFTKFREITQCNGHCAVQGHSRSQIWVPIESSYTTSY